MSEFDERRAELSEARSQSEAAERERARARERVRALELERRRLARGLDPRDREDDARLEELEAAAAEAARALERAEAEHGRLRDAAAGLLDGFEQFSDPREQIERLSDEFPLLLLPVRLETRFKALPAEGREGPDRHELWVRVYPDTCAIDTFEATLSEGDVRAGRLYWQELWRAGGIEEDERAAWRGLVASQGSGRAAWILANYEPENLDQQPVKAAREELVLVIGSDTPPPEAERTALAAYWRAHWLAGDDLQREGQALAALRAAVGGGDRAAELIDSYRPFNLSDRPPLGTDRDDITVSAAWVLFPTGVETKRDAWTQAPRTRVLPDRFVLIARSGEDRLEQVGRPVRSPLIVGPDPSAPPAEQLRPEDGDLVVPDELLWLTDFDRAVEWGLGFKLPLTAAQAERGFDRVLVAGIRMSADEQTAKELVEELFEHHHYGRSGLSVLRQGTPTNNTERSGSGVTDSDDPDQSFDDLLGGTGFTATSDPLRKADGQWLAEALGIDATVVERVPGADASDQSEARALQLALWPGTLGYFMDALMAPGFSDATVEAARRYFTRYVSGRGALPAIRVGSQPYGILPTTAFSRISWLERRGGGVSTHLPAAGAGFLSRLHRLLRLADADWGALAADAAHVGAAGDPHRLLLEILGLHPASAEYHYRYASSTTHLFNHLNLLRQGDDLLEAIEGGRLDEDALDLLGRLGYDADELPAILRLWFRSSQGALHGELVDDRPLSESEEVRDWTEDGRNYIEWLAGAARTSLEALRTQAGFEDDKPPSALLYLLLRHALILGYSDAGYRAYRAADFLQAEQLAALKREPPYVHVTQEGASESRWAPLYAAESRVTGTEGLAVAEHITAALDTADEAANLREQIEAVERLAHLPTARLERLLAEHVDCCAYRLDAWLLGLVHVQLEAMRRGAGDDDAGAARTGLHLGAYAWLEDLRPDPGDLSSVDLPEDLELVFKRPGDAELTRDPTSGGFVHAPSTNHAVTAAVLRSAYLAHADESNPGALTVNLSSERVRLALSLLEGVRGEQSLGALLGYRFERGLHDRHGLAEVDRFVFALRKQFPLRADHLSPTQTPPDVPIEAIEARNVVDGLRLVEHVTSPGRRAYPFGLDLPQASGPERQAIDAEVDRLLDVHDAVADLALAEGVHQAVQGNYDRVAGTLDAYTQGNFPPEPDVVRSPTSGFMLTHRVGLQLRSGLAAPANATPRSVAEPGLNDWLRTVLPPLSDISCEVKWRHPVTDAPGSTRVTMAALGLHPLDLLYLIGTETEQAMTELDDRVARRVLATQSLRPDTRLEIGYIARPAAGVSVFEVAPLVRHLRSLVLRARPLRASDVALPNEAQRSRDDAVFADRARVAATRDLLDDLGADVTTYLAALDPLVTPPVGFADRTAILAGVDGFLDDAVALLARAARFGIPETGWGFLLEWRRGEYAGLVGLLRERVSRWSARQAQLLPLLIHYDDLPAPTPAEERLELLRRAEALIATTLTPGPVAPNLLRDAIDDRLTDFEDRRNDLRGVANGSAGTLAELLDDVRALLPLTDFDPEPFPLADAEDRAVAFVTDLARALRALGEEVARRTQAAGDQLSLHDASASAPARVEALTAGAQALLGEDFRIVPDFELAPGQGDEWRNALDASQGGDLLQHLVDDVKIEFPVDEWLHGVARVRDQIRAWEQALLLSGAFGRPERALLPIQLPFRPDDSWLALQFPDDYDLDRERLLYTAHYAGPFDPTERQCGLLLDEWTEVIPAAEQMTGIAFHHDRPNCEAPQSLLLVTPARWDGSWQWADVVGALDETLELAKKRAVEPTHVDATPYARFLPATVAATSVRGASIGVELAAANHVAEYLELRTDA